MQAAFVEEMNKVTEEMKNSQPKSGGNKAIVLLSVLILLGVIADIVLQVLSMCNFKLF